MQTTQVCLEYVPAYGGSALAARDYATARESAVIAFTSAGNLQGTQGWDENVFRIPIRSDFMGCWYALPDSTSTTVVDCMLS